MLNTYMKFEGSDGTAFSGVVTTDDVKEFQKMQKHIVHALIKLGDDGAAGILPVATDAKTKPQMSSVISMETIGEGKQGGFYAKITQENRFDHPSNYAAEIDFCSNLLGDVIEKFKAKK